MEGSLFAGWRDGILRGEPKWTTHEGGQAKLDDPLGGILDLVKVPKTRFF